MPPGRAPGHDRPHGTHPVVRRSRAQWDRGAGLAPESDFPRTNSYCISIDRWIACTIAKHVYLAADPIACIRARRRFVRWLHFVDSHLSAGFQLLRRHRSPTTLGQTNDVARGGRHAPEGTTSLVRRRAGRSCSNVRIRASGARRAGATGVQREKRLERVFGRGGHSE
ncbi:protein of unknown function [Burkholderia multivorans]